LTLNSASTPMAIAGRPSSNATLNMRSTCCSDRQRSWRIRLATAALKRAPGRTARGARPAPIPPPPLQYDREPPGTSSRHISDNSSRRRRFARCKCVFTVPSGTSSDSASASYRTPRR
jgi:hypothetical protein